MNEDVATDEMAQVIVTLRLRFKPGMVDYVLEQVLPIARVTREEEGNIAFDVFKTRDHEDQLVIFERWRDQAALERHWAEPYTKEVLSLFEEKLLRPLSEAEDVTYLLDMMHVAGGSG